MSLFALLCGHESTVKKRKPQYGSACAQSSIMCGNQSSKMWRNPAEPSDKT